MNIKKMQNHCGKNKDWFCLELPVTEYREAWELQTKLVNARKEGIIDRDIVLLLEHHSVFTNGRHAGLNDMLVSRDFLEKKGIKLIKIERGGNITFHGPGQLIMYPIIDLNLARLGVAEYILNLEEVMIRAASEFGIRAYRSPINRGVWVRNKKLGSIGIAIRRGIAFHGLAINVNLGLEPFSWINPCGLKNMLMTSIEHELSGKVAMNKVKKIIKIHIGVVFGTKLETISLKHLNRLWDLKNAPE